jgi:hypothetical protein
LSICSRKDAGQADTARDQSERSEQADGDREFGERPSAGARQPSALASSAFPASFAGFRGPFRSRSSMRSRLAAATMKIESPNLPENLPPWSARSVPKPVTLLMAAAVTLAKHSHLQTGGEAPSRRARLSLAPRHLAASIGTNRSQRGQYPRPLPS